MLEGGPNTVHTDTGFSWKRRGNVGGGGGKLFNPPQPRCLPSLRLLWSGIKKAQTQRKKRKVATGKVNRKAGKWPTESNEYTRNALFPPFTISGFCFRGKLHSIEKTKYNKLCARPVDLRRYKLRYICVWEQISCQAKMADRKHFRRGGKEFFGTLFLFGTLNL